MDFEFGIASAASFIVAAIVVSIIIVTYLGSKTAESKTFAFLMIWVAAWIISHGFFHGAQTEGLAYLFVRFNYFFGVLIATSFFNFSYTFYREKFSFYRSGVPVVLMAVLFGCLYFAPRVNHLLISGVNHIGGLQGWEWIEGTFFNLFDVVFMSFFIASLVFLFIKWKKSDGLKRTAALYMFLAMFIGSLPPSFMNVVLPSRGYYKLDWLGTLTSLLWVVVVAYSIYKHNQMNVRVVFTEILVFAAMLLLLLWVFI